VIFLDVTQEDKFYGSKKSVLMKLIARLNFPFYGLKNT
jgi:hypothetical protein